MEYRLAGIMQAMLAVAASAVFFAACGDLHNISGEDYGNIAAGPSGTILTRDEHKAGWGKSGCFECHNTENMHQQDRTGTGINMAAIRQLTRADGLASCPACHGSNGVE